MVIGVVVIYNSRVVKMVVGVSEVYSVILSQTLWLSYVNICKLVSSNHYSDKIILEKLASVTVSKDFY